MNGFENGGELERQRDEDTDGMSKSSNTPKGERPELRDVAPYPHLFFLEDALRVIPIANENALRQWLYRHRHEMPPPKYLYAEYGRKYRMLSVAEIKFVQSRVKLTLRGFLALMHRT